MSADFWAGYISGAVGIIIGNPLDVLKVRMQAGILSSPSSSSSSPTSSLSSRTSSSASRLNSSPSSASPSSNSPLLPTTTTTTTTSPKLTTTPGQAGLSGLRTYIRPSTWITGTAAPVLGYGALNALLFVSYNRTEAFLNNSLSLQSPPTNSTGSGNGSNLWTTFLAGCVGGLATFVVSTPTELIKCRAQLLSQSSSSSSWAITKHVLRIEGLRGLYFGGTVTALRDSIGYGFYFWSYEFSSRYFSTDSKGSNVLLCGGLAGIVTWASIFPLDVIKTRVQTQILLPENGVTQQQQQQRGGRKVPGAWKTAQQTYRQSGNSLRPFFRGLGVCSVRAFIVNAVQWAVYEWIMAEMTGVGRRRVPVDGKSSEAVL
ncbi:mitochondrial carrier domain-containing protein [Apodospora peruviana]|uniref:Mitochondrial carrier domain-containing protein n=1 Tax=Apodospora peruviana TaxID=516989 RepID=A0AAE0HWB4_9PEZI|nr:mitochondrial carrier domain-containing protein [Apodospora peruviana]